LELVGDVAKVNFPILFTPHTLLPLERVKILEDNLAAVPVMSGGTLAEKLVKIKTIWGNFIELEEFIQLLHTRRYLNIIAGNNLSGILIPHRIEIDFDIPIEELTEGLQNSATQMSIILLLENRNKIVCPHDHSHLCFGIIGEILS